MSAAQEFSATGMAARTAAILFVFVIIFTGLLSGAYLWTKPAIEASAVEEKMKLVDEVLQRSEYDNDLLSDTIALPATPELALTDPTLLYRARSPRSCAFSMSRGGPCARSWPAFRSRA